MLRRLGRGGDASPGQDILDTQYSSPAAAKIDGRWQVIHGFGDGWLRGFDARTGQLLWKFAGTPPGLEFRPVVGERFMVNFVRYEPHTEAPRHAHEEEQITFVIDGEFEFDLDGDVQTMRLDVID